MSTKKPKYVFPKSLINKLIRIADEQPTAVILYLKILSNVGTRRRSIKGYPVEIGQMALKYKQENIFFGTSRKRFRRDRYCLIKNGMIENNRIELITFISVNGFDAIINQTEREKDCVL